MRKMFQILANSLRLTFQELKVNKLRTGLSLTGVAFGIFCIIGVLATVNSLQYNIQNEVNSLGSNTIYIDKWEYGGGPDKPWWKYRARPVMKYEEVALLKQRSELADEISFFMRANGNLSHKDDVIENASVYGITESQTVVQPIAFAAGRYISSAEFNNGTAVGLMGFDNAEKLYGSAERAVGKYFEIKGKRVTIVGVIKKDGKTFIGSDNDNCVMLPYKFVKQIVDERNSNPVIIAKGKDNVTPTQFSTELEGAMRQIRRLSPTQEDNFSLNSVEAFSKAIGSLFGTVDVVGGLIGVVSLIVGMFGIANIMFVTVKERTSMIGLKKAIGAKRSSILFEFLMEAAILCLMGGAIGLLLVYILTIVFSKLLEFPVFVSIPLLIGTVVICLVVGILAGIFPASRAAKMDPVVAIRSK
jgi:putative ABC transport system permease protein